MRAVHLIAVNTSTDMDSVSKFASYVNNSFVPVQGALLESARYRLKSIKSSSDEANDHERTVRAVHRGVSMCRAGWQR